MAHERDDHNLCSWSSALLPINQVNVSAYDLLSLQASFLTISWQHISRFDDGEFFREFIS